MNTGSQSNALHRARDLALRLRGRARYAAGHAPARVALLVFSAATLLFTGLLMLPVASADGTRTALSDALFTAVSAVTVTGLTTVDTAEHWSMFGQVVILVAIQTGALGVVTIALLLAMMVTRKLGVSSRVFAKESIGANGIGSVGRLLRVVVTTTFIIESVLALFLVPAFIASGESFGPGLWHGIFYAISAFGNAGFTPHAGGLAVFADNQAEATEHTAGEQVRASSWFGKRRARDEHENAQARTAEARQQVTSEWGEPPRWDERADAWVERVTRPRIDSDPRVIDAEQEHRAARDALLHRPERAQTERLVAFARVFGAETVIRNQQAYLTTNPMQQATRAAKTAKQAREEAELLRSLTPAEATERIEQTRAAQAEREAQRAERERAMSHDYEEQHRSAPRRDGPTLGL
ncbi:MULTISPECIES: potassium transporter TrkG [Gulosibacter]|uniref:potassium transporter TrkG n=1 Tax=Gulosibacter TaxID=256818 RepID=UPI000F63D7A1|nr:MULTISPECIES: potassium transporter TrkG [Gulosibacter]